MLGHYLSTALRNFRRDPLSTAIKLLALALGLACFLTAHVIGDYFRQADRHWMNADRIAIVVQEMRQQDGGWRSNFQGSGPGTAALLRTDFPQLEAAARLFLAAMYVGPEDSTQSLQGSYVDPEFLEIFDLEMIRGRASLDDPRTVILSQRGAQRLFGDDDPVGRTLRLRMPSSERLSLDVTVTGVFRDIPGNSHFAAANWMEMDVLSGLSTWVAVFLMANDPDTPLWWEEEAFASTNFATYALLPGNGSLGVREINRALPDFAQRHVPSHFPESRFRAAPLAGLAEARFNDLIGFPPGFSLVDILYALGALALLAGCVNFAALSSAGAVARAQEIGLRKAVGARRRQIVAQSLIESGAVVFLALALAAPLSVMLAGVLAPPLGLPPDMPGVARPDYWLGVALIAVVVALAAGTWPALALARLHPVTAARTGGGERGGGGVRGLLSAAQFAVAAGLMIVVAVMAMQAAGMRQTLTRPAEDPLVFANIPGNVPMTPEGTLDWLVAIQSRLAAHPAVLAASYDSYPPFYQTTSETAEFAQSPDPMATRFVAQGRNVYADYFTTQGVRILAGRDFSHDRDDSLSVIIDEETARLMGYAPHEAIGQSLYRVAAQYGVAGEDGLPPEHVVIGVVETAPMDLMAGGPENYAYVMRPFSMGFALVRLSRHDVAGGLEHIRTVWRDFDPGGQPANPRFLDEFFDTYFRFFRMVLVACAGLAGVALFIAAMGLFGMASFVVQRRVREIGVRKVLGASTPRVLGMMLWDFSKPVIVANLIAWPAAWIAARAYLNLFVTRIELTIWPFLAALAVSLLIAWLAVGAHALRAASVKPALVLRAE